MAVAVKVPTILRTYTGGDKQVSGSGGTLGEVLDDLESRHSGFKDRVSTGPTCVASSTSTSTMRTSASPADSTPASRTATPSSFLPAVAGG
jgi:hypothetical protein